MTNKKVQEYLEGSQEVEFLPSGELVPLGKGKSAKGKGVQLAPHTFY